MWDHDVKLECVFVICLTCICLFFKIKWGFVNILLGPEVAGHGGLPGRSAGCLLWAACMRSGCFSCTYFYSSSPFPAFLLMPLKTHLFPVPCFLQQGNRGPRAPPAPGVPGEPSVQTSYNLSLQESDGVSVKCNSRAFEDKWNCSFFEMEIK